MKDRTVRHIRFLLILLVAIGTTWLSSCSGDSTTDPVKLGYRVQNGQLKAGYYCLCWNQRNQQGELVSPGGYRVHMVAGTFNASLDFTITDNAARVTAPICCDTATVGTLKPSKEVPDNFELSINSRSYSSGDSIAVEYALPVSCQCTITMEQR